MIRYSVVIPTALILLFTVLISGQSDAVRRCFQFTWLGHRYTNESVFMNATCSDATRLSAGVPCVHPLVVSYDGSWPDVDFIWENYPNASCILADNDVCAKYTFSFDGVGVKEVNEGDGLVYWGSGTNHSYNGILLYGLCSVENSTYFCTRAINDMGNAIRNGCYEQVNGSHSTRVCFCQSIPGARPCNSGCLHAINYLTFVLFILAIILQHYTNKT